MSRVQVIQRSKLSFRESDVPPAFLNAMARRLTFQNPAWVRARARTRFVSADIPERLVYMERVKGWAMCPRGALAMLRAEAVRHGVAIQVVDRRTSLPVIQRPAVGRAARPYQGDALAVMARREEGQVILPCGGGKTWIGSRFLVQSGQPGLVLVHTMDLADQWEETLIDQGVTPRVLGAGRAPDWRPLRLGELAVGMVQTLGRADTADLSSLLGSTGALLVDEAHRAPSAGFARVIHHCAARYRFGLTATPDRPDGLSFAMGLLFGPPVFRRAISELVTDGYLSMPLVVPVETGWAPSRGCFKLRNKNDPTSETLDFVKATDEMAACHPRNVGIVDLAAASADAGRCTLVLVSRVDHAMLLAEMVRARGLRVYAATGEVNREVRRAILDDTRAGLVPVIVATQLADEGLDVPNLDCLILAGAGKAKGRAYQRIGRVMRPSGMPPLVFDLVDPDIRSGGAFVAQFGQRRMAYRAEIGVSTERACSFYEAMNTIRGVQPMTPLLHGADDHILSGPVE